MLHFTKFAKTVSKYAKRLSKYAKTLSKSSKMNEIGSKTWYFGNNLVLLHLKKRTDYIKT